MTDIHILLKPNIQQHYASNTKEGSLRFYQKIYKRGRKFIKANMNETAGYVNERGKKKQKKNGFLLQ